MNPGKITTSPTKKSKESKGEIFSHYHKKILELFSSAKTVLSSRGFLPKSFPFKELGRKQNDTFCEMAKLKKMSLSYQDAQTKVYSCYLDFENSCKKILSENTVPDPKVVVKTKVVEKIVRVPVPVEKKEEYSRDGILLLIEKEYQDALNSLTPVVRTIKKPKLFALKSVLIANAKLMSDSGSKDKDKWIKFAREIKRKFDKANETFIDKKRS